MVFGYVAAMGLYTLGTKTLPLFAVLAAAAEPGGVESMTGLLGAVHAALAAAWGAGRDAAGRAANPCSAVH